MGNNSGYCEDSDLGDLDDAYDFNWEAADEYWTEYAPQEIHEIAAEDYKDQIRNRYVKKKLAWLDR